MTAAPTRGPGEQLAWHAFGRLSGAAFSIGIIALLTRILQPAEFGTYSVLIFLAGLAYIAVLQWLRILVDRELPNAGPDGARLTGGILLTTGLSVVGLALVSCTVALLVPASKEWVVLGFAFTVSYAVFEIAMAVARARLQAARVACLHLLKGAIGLGLSYLLVRGGFGVAGAVHGLVAAHVVCAILALAPLPRVADLRLPSLSFLRRSLMLTLPVSLSLALCGAINGVGRVALQISGREGEAGLFSAAFDLAGQGLILLAAIVHSGFYPSLVRAHDSGETERFRQLWLQFGQFTIAGLAFGIGILVALSGPLTGLALGSEFRDGAQPIFILACFGAGSLGFANFFTDAAFQLRRRTGALLAIGGLGLLVNLALLGLLIPRYGAIGAACATVGANLSYLLLSWLVGRRHLALGIGRPEEVLAALAPAVGAVLPALLCVSLLDLRPVLVIFIGGMLGLAGALTAALLSDFAGSRRRALALVIKIVRRQ
ncbi:lipopolysaccharide biosynthesis protein [Thermaurantiacus sp.]